MMRTNLDGLTEEEKRARKLKQKAEAQKRYYEKHKDYYNTKASIEAKRIRRNYRNALKYIEQQKSILGVDFWGSGFDDLEEILKK